MTTPPEWVAVQEVLSKQPPQGLVCARSVDVYTDGSAPYGNPGGPIGFACVFVSRDKGRAALSASVPAGQTSNNRAEIAAFLMALASLAWLLDKGASYTRVVVWSDSEYVIQAATGKSKRKKNLDLWNVVQPLWDRLQSALPRGLELFWTRGHSGNRYNEEADRLAFLAVPPPQGKASAMPTPTPAKVAAPPVIPEPDYRLRVLVREYQLMTRAKRCRRLAPLEAAQLGGNQAEYVTLCAALSDLWATVGKAGRRADEFELVVESACELMIKQLRGEYKVRSAELQPLHSKARELLAVWKAAELRWVPCHELRSQARVDAEVGKSAT